MREIARLLRACTGVILFNNMSTMTLFTNTGICTMYVFIALFEKNLWIMCLSTQLNAE